MDSSKKISVLFPNYNNGPFLKEALDSVFAQSYQNFEIIFVDDCSSDNGVEIAKSYNDERIKIFQKDTNSGIVDTMNLGLEHIDTEYFIRMDGDDISTPDRFEKLVAFMEANPKIGICSSAIKTFGAINEVMKYEKDPEMNKANLIFGHSIGHASSIFRTAVFKDNGITYVDRFWRMEDYYLFYQLRNHANSTAIDDELYLYRREDYNYNEEIMEKKRKEFYRFYEMVLEEMGIDFTDQDVKTHIQLSLREQPSMSYSDYKAHIEKLLEANQRSNSFPQNGLKRVMDKYISKLLPKLIDKKAVGFFQLVPQFSKNKGLFRYYCAKKLGRS